ncbi:hypothetical protein BC835DRAFT_984863 [Cytidiella melzeri]|nr:hypothetical protein BC835DRAFT_984863 [Cytidiella melzeri]
MPRRPRPVSRKPPAHAAHIPHTPQTPKANSKAVTRPTPQEAEESSEGEESLEGASGSGSGSVDEDSEADADAPRVAQWVADEELEEEGDESSSDGEEEFESDNTRPVNLKRLQDNLSSLPLGTLRKAQQALAQAKPAHGDEPSDDEAASSDEESAPEQEPSGLGAKDRQKRDIAKRAHKHAPMEMSSKRPVPRKKANIDESKPVPRDPRFLHTTGTFSPAHFRTQYSFLSELHLSELNTLRENLKRARKLLVNSPRDLRQEREAEVLRLERALKRAESLVNRDKKEKIEDSALGKLMKEEKEKRKEGKGAWYMKESDKKDLLARAKFEALAEAGGRSAVRKAIEKKQKKVNQKEKKRRPFVPGEARGQNGKRPNPNSIPWQGRDGARPSKRQRTS